jgi:hypothetical protein
MDPELTPANGAETPEHGRRLPREEVFNCCDDVRLRCSDKLDN